MQSIPIIDSNIFYFIHSVAGKSVILDNLIIFFAEYFPYVMVIILFVFLLKEAISIREKIYIFSYTLLSGFLGRGLIEVIRFFYHRPRPFIQYNFIPLVSESSYSFPSGHAIFFFAFSFSVFFLHKRLGWLFISFSVLMGIARIASGVHFPSDIIAGAIIGYLISYAVEKFAHPFFRRKLHIE